MSKAKKVDAAVAEQVTQEIFAIPRDVLQSTIDTLANYPYREVGNLVNVLRGLQPVEKDEE